MRLLDRYLLRELLWPLGFCLGGFLTFLICFDIFSRIDKFQDNHLRLLDIAQYYAVRLPEFLVTVLPIALLLSLLYALTHHARYHELTAIRAAGVSVWRMCASYFAVGLVAAIALAVINEAWAPDAGARAERILTSRLQPQAAAPVTAIYHNLGLSNGRDHRKWQIGAYNAETHEMLDPKLDWRLPDGNDLEVVAKRAIWTNGAWLFFDVLENTYAPGSAKIINRVLAPMTNLPGLTETPDVLKRELRVREHLGAFSGNADLPVADLLHYLRLHPDLTPQYSAQLHTRLQGRLAAPFTCLVVVLIAIPFGAAPGRRNIFVGVASSILICFAYFVLQQGCMALGAGGHLWPWLAAWAPNLIAAGAGVWLSWRMQ